MTGEDLFVILEINVRISNQILSNEGKRLAELNLTGDDKENYRVTFIESRGLV